MSKQKILVGIDPDVEKNGVAYKNGDVIDLQNLSFFELFDYLKLQKEFSENNKIPLMVFIEAGWLNKSNWHQQKNASAAMNAKIGNNTGRNHETGRKIVEMLDYLNIKYLEIKPKESKVNARLFKMITKIKKRTNQETRDAYMLIHGL